jgi:iron complex transport system substrate-binding protein
MLLAACGGQPEEIPVPPPSPPDEAGQNSAIIVVDALGRTIKFAEPPQRIVLAGKSTLTVVNTLYLFPEAAERLAGLVVGRQDPGEFLGLVDPSFGEKTVLEVDAGPEQIAPLQPDAVVLRSFMADGLGRALEELDLPVIYVDLETPEQFARDLSTLGQLLGNEARAAEIQAFYQARLDRIAEALKDLGDEQRPRILLLQHSNQGGQVAFTVPSASWIQTTEAELAGGIPVWTEAAQGGGWTIVSLEQIAAWDPDKIFVTSYNLDSSDVVEKLRKDPQWQALRAMEADQVFGFAGDLYSWDQPDPRWILGTIWLAEKIHPDDFSDLDTMEEVFAFYRQMYGLDEAPVEEHIVPSLRGDIE